MKDYERAARLIEHAAKSHDDHAPCPVGRMLHDLASRVRALPSGGPAQVATPQYRSNYETIFGKKVERGLA